MKQVKVSGLKNRAKPTTKKEMILTLIKDCKFDSYKDIANALGCTVKSVQDYVWCIQYRDGIRLANF